MLPWPYRLQRSSRRRRLAVKVNPQGEILALAPLRLPLTAVERFLAQAAPWIEQQLALVRMRLTELPPKRFEAGEMFSLLGREYELQLGPTPRREVRLIGGILVVPARDAEQARKMLTAFYRREAARILTGKTQAMAALWQLPVTQVRISRAAGRWGSCSRSGSINYSWRLIQCPEEAVDYVVAHELAHCREMNHSERFYAVLAEFFPEWRRYERFLKTEGWRYGGW